MCDEKGIQPTVFYQYQKKLFEQGAAILERSRALSRGPLASEAHQIEGLERKLVEKNEILAELMGEYVALKKRLAVLQYPSGLASRR